MQIQKRLNTPSLVLDLDASFHAVVAADIASMETITTESLPQLEQQ